jgi:2-dehydropantoate 2-reductase
MRIVVIGAGAIGGFVGGKLAASGQDVMFVDRPQLVEVVRAQGLHIIEQTNDTAVQPGITTELAEAFAPYLPADLVLLCVKAFDTQTVIDQLRPFTAKFRSVMTIQNGVRNEEILSEAFGADKVLSATITHPVVVPEPGVVRSEKTRGGIGVAPVGNQDVTNWVDVINQAGIVTRGYADWRAMKWSKLLLNIIGNASSAILNLNTMRVFNDPRLVTLEVDQLREAIAVMTALKLEPVELPAYPVPLLVMAIRFLPTPIVGMIMRPLVVSGRKEKLPSLLIELNRGSGKSEVDDLNGAVVQIGQRVGVRTPVNSTLVATLNLMTQMPSQREAWNQNAERLTLVARGAQKEARQKQ